MTCRGCGLDNHPGSCIEALLTALSEARNAALGEAAKVAEAYVYDRGSMTVQAYIAAAIRALKSTGGDKG